MAIKQNLGPQKKDISANVHNKEPLLDKRWEEHPGSCVFAVTLIHQKAFCLDIKTYSSIPFVLPSCSVGSDCCSPGSHPLCFHTKTRRLALRDSQRLSPRNYSEIKVLEYLLQRLRDASRGLSGALAEKMKNRERAQKK